MLAVLPPSYSVSNPAPQYSNLPLEDEETVEYTPRGNSSSVPSGNMIKNSAFMTLILKDQNPDDDLPTYGRGSVVYGEIGLVRSASILSVSVKLKGFLSTSISDTGSETSPVVSEKITLWSQDATRCDQCPSVLPFAIPFPTTFRHLDVTRPLPPSFHDIFYSLPAISAHCTYLLKVTVHKSAPKYAFWNAPRSYSLQLNYRPRTRPQRPISHISGFLSTFKHIPEDWLQIESTMYPRRSAIGVKPISCHIFIPSVGAFGLTDAIPFHIQLSSSLASLRLLLPEDGAEIKRPASVRAYIARQTMVEAKDRKSWRTATLGEGSLRAIAPAADATFAENTEVYVDWEGEVRCNEEERHGGFNVGSVIIRDFLVFALTPPNPRTCPLLPHQYAQPIRLVTDVWTDDSASHHPLDT